ncbi:transcription elongation factor GreB [Klebsiella oxytoca]|nr:transcription elongation factor GreB [Klebsiella oxytoca]
MKTPLITREGYEKLKKEMDTLVARRTSGSH